MCRLHKNASRRFNTVCLTKKGFPPEWSWSVHVVVVVVRRVVKWVVVWKLPIEFVAQTPLVAVEEPLVSVVVIDHVVFFGENQVETIVVDSKEGRKFHCFDCMDTISPGCVCLNRFNFICNTR